MSAIPPPPVLDNFPQTSPDVNSNSSSKPADKSSDLNLSSIPSIPIKRTLMLSNQFIINTVSFVNSFSTNANERLAIIHNKLQKLEIVLKLLETKLKSIPLVSTDLPVNNPDDIAIVSNTNNANNIVSAPTDSNQADPKQPNISSVLLKDDTLYSKYFKMLRLGVPVAQVKQRMGIDGLDPSVADMDSNSVSPNPDAKSVHSIEEDKSDDDF